uniref:Phosphate uptake regulator n=1 Tax=uncultured marine thaumarchaeote KM3_79_H02 TaxID=1456297 RepID=A0A075HNF7_9ARCH|nr:phosphate uptake regulator [uncultured marine thaumarchaeote KM3_79_H02]
MGQFFSWVKSNEKEILVTLDDLAKKAVEISEALVVMLSDLKNAECHKEIHTLETQADSLVREIFYELNRTFITPLDREDMQRVASKIDDTIDHIDGISARLHSYKITTTPPYALDIANELVKSTKEVELMTSKLRNIKNPSSMIEHCRNTSAIEHKVDDLYSLAMTKLFEGNDPIEIIKLKDIYESLETASDRCVDVADVVEDIVLKYT